MTETKIMKWSDEDRDKAGSLNIKINAVLDSIKNKEELLSGNLVEIGVLLSKVQNEQYWILWGFDKFSTYIESLRTKYGKGRTQLYQYISVAEYLLPIVSQKDLIGMGIGKAIELKKLVSQDGTVSKELVAKAIDPEVTIDEFKKAAFGDKHPSDGGNYFSFGACYLSESEKDEVESAFYVARHLDPPIQNTLPAIIQTKEIMLRICREFYGTYASQVGTG
jgi:hypothetical protein